MHHINKEKWYMVHMPVAGDCGLPCLWGLAHSMPHDAHWLYVHDAWEEGHRVYLF